jgi:hypothetical protein
MAIYNMIISLLADVLVTYHRTDFTCRVTVIHPVKKFLELHVQQGPSWAANSRSAIQEIPFILLSPTSNKVLTRVSGNGPYPQPENPDTTWYSAYIRCICILFSLSFKKHKAYAIFMLSVFVSVNSPLLALECLNLFLWQLVYIYCGTNVNVKVNNCPLIKSLQSVLCLCL